MVFYVGGKGKIRYNYTLAPIVNNNTGKWGVPLGTPTTPYLSFNHLQDIPIFKRDNTGELALNEVKGILSKIPPSGRDWGRHIRPGG